MVSKAVGLYIMKPILTKEKVNITGPIGFATKAFDLAPQVSQLKGKNIDYVGLAGITPVAIRVVKEMRRQGIKAPIIGGQIWADPEIVEKWVKMVMTRYLRRLSITISMKKPATSPKNL